MNPITKRAGLIAVVLVLVGAAAVLIWRGHRHVAQGELLLYGNVDLRQIDLPFNGSERIADVDAQEGDHVRAGQVLARLDASRLQPQVAKAQAELAAQQQVVERLQHGNRPEEIAQARASVEAAQAESDDARAHYQRLSSLSDRSDGRAVSRQDLDSARASLDNTQAKLQMNQKALALEVAGARKEDIAQAQAQLRSDQAQLALLQQQLRDAELRAPVDAVIRARLMEPGEIASPQKAVFTLAITDPKWVRAYVDESNLARIREGLAASVTVDGLPGLSIPGWVGFISPIAEFTPKSVETAELRSSLVYEVRVFVKDPQDRLRLGMPATVHIARADKASAQ
ncbi:MAG TPA: HlyD family efflux transporter periplasmic adaptor subunit [Steroidobacteraceae bacterium]|nr:HlyD family efflux transporter periplasmic adaptor subunit [Steroidobacteraceae bacterium]